MVLYATLRKRYRLIDICSVSGIIILYLFCALRMLLPIEFPWVKVVPAEHFYNTVYSAIRMEIGFFGLKVYHVALSIWILGTIIGVVRLCIRYRKQGRRIEEQTTLGMVIKPDTYNIRDKSVNIIKTAAVQVPMSFGIIRKRILIPEGIYTESEKQLIVHHEYMHLRNNDPLVQMLINILCALYWWNPFVYLLRIDLEQYFELRCDANVTKGMTNSQIADYLEVLLKAYKSDHGLSNNIGLCLLGLKRKSGDRIKERFLILSKRTSRQKKVVGKITALLITGVLMVLSYSFILQSSYDVPIDEFGNDGINHEINQDNSYLIKNADGNYIWRTMDGFEKAISPETATMLIEDGFNVYDE